MKHFYIGCFLFFVAFNYSKAQSSFKLDFINKVPAAIKNCGALYTYDTTAFTKKKYILVVDFQNKGLIAVVGKQIPLTLVDTKLAGKDMNVTTYVGDDYTVILSTKTIKQTTKIDTEEGTIVITKGKNKRTIKIHGQSACDASKEEGN